MNGSTTHMLAPTSSPNAMPTKPDAPQGVVIYHMAPHVAWTGQPPDRPYVTGSLAVEGFIHCTAEPDRLAWVANRFYREMAGEFIILAIDVARVRAEIRWELADGHHFPHIYGPIDREAISAIYPFPRQEDGIFFLPPQLVTVT
ncbi:MAG: DUF952 domain-containing protein [Caldilineaceae bacterium]|nr:DUF952 domain-containing protein [Caldilineaceae bacterium]